MGSPCWGYSAVWGGCGDWGCVSREREEGRVVKIIHAILNYSSNLVVNKFEVRDGKWLDSIRILLEALICN